MPDSEARLISVPLCSHACCANRARIAVARRGFTIVDVLVTMAVIAVLMSLLAPSLSTVRQAANQVVCRSNVRQLGFGIFMYAGEHADEIPRSLVASPTPAGLDRPWETVTLRFGIQRGPNLAGDWDGLGYLYSEDYLPAPKIFYCPAHRGDHKFVEAISGFVQGDEEVVGNYQYRGRGPSRINQPTLAAAGMTTKLSLIHPNAAIVSDSLRTQADFNHEIGANILRASQAVEWYPDTNRSVLALLPKDGFEPVESGAFTEAWGHFDEEGP